jgi:hypothetical protein
MFLKPLLCKLSVLYGLMLIDCDKNQFLRLFLSVSCYIGSQHRYGET